MDGKQVVDLSEVRMMSSAEVGRVFGMSANAVWHAAKDGRLPPAVLVGKRMRWLEADIRDFINRQRGAS